MENKKIAAIVWSKGQPFTSLYDAFLVASSRHEILWIVDEDLNVATLNGNRAEDVLSSFEEDPKLSLVYGDEPNFVFVRSEDLLEVLNILRLNPPQDFRDLTKFFRDSLFCKDLCNTKWFPLSFGKMIGSESFRKAIESGREEIKKEEKLRGIVERLEKDHPDKVRPILEELGEAALKELRISDTDWRLNWIIKRLEREGYSKSELLDDL